MSPAHEDELELLRRLDGCARTDLWSRVAEGLLLALGGIPALLALAVVEGHAPADPAAVGAAVAGGVLLALAWPLARVRSRAALVAWVAGELGARELSAVHDTLQRGSPGPLTGLAAARLNERFERARLRAVAQGNMWRFLAAPMVGGLLLSWVSDSSAPPATADMGAALEALSSSATSAAQQILEQVGAGDMDQAMADAVLEVARGARALDSADPEALEAWLDQAEELALALQREGQRSEALDAARAAAEAASLAANASGARRAEAEGGDGDESGAVAADPDGGPGGDDRGGSGQGSVAQGTPGEGTMPGQPQPAQVSPTPAVAAAARAALDPRDAALVQEFLSRLPEPTPPREP